MIGVILTLNKPENFFESPIVEDDLMRCAGGGFLLMINAALLPSASVRAPDSCLTRRKKL